MATESFFADDGAVAISLRGVTKTYPGTAAPAVDSLDLEIPAGGIVALVGPSGCGKTTTLKMINRLVEPTAGVIEVGGVDIRSPATHELRRHIGYVIQHTGLFPHLDIEANMGTVPRLLGWPKKRITQRVDELVELVGLEPDMLRRYPPELSGGQQQRVGVARALAADPPVLLMDEPYSAVDPIVRARLQDELLDLQATVGKTIVLVTHDIDEAIKLGDRIAVLEVGGILAQFASPAELLAAPASPFVSEFLGEDRGLKRLALLRVADVTVEPGPTFDVAGGRAAARAVMDAQGTDWAVALDGATLRGWVGHDDVADAAAGSDVACRDFTAVVAAEDTLRTALDGIVNSATRAAAVRNADGTYAGILSIDAISAGARA